VFLLNGGPRLSLSKKAEKSSRNDARSITFQRPLNGRRSSSAYRHVTIPTSSKRSMCANSLTQFLPHRHEKEGRQSCMATPPRMKKGTIGVDVLAQRSFLFIEPHEPARKTDRGEYRNHTLSPMPGEPLLSWST
jgi:hypothetical protein